MQEHDMPLARAYRAKRRAEIKAMRARRRADAVTQFIAAIALLAFVHIVGQCILGLF